jgi:hypothetical protein
MTQCSRAPTASTTRPTLKGDTARHARHHAAKAIHAQLLKTLATTMATRPQEAPPQGPVDLLARPRQRMAQERERKRKRTRKSHSVHIGQEMDNRVDHPASASVMTAYRPGGEITLAAYLAAAGRRPLTSSSSDSSDSASSVERADGPGEGVPGEVVPESADR